MAQKGGLPFLITEYKDGLQGGPGCAYGALRVLYLCVCARARASVSVSASALQPARFSLVWCCAMALIRRQTR